MNNADQEAQKEFDSIIGKLKRNETVEATEEFFYKMDEEMDEEGSSMEQDNSTYHLVLFVKLPRITSLSSNNSITIRVVTYIQILQLTRVTQKFQPQ